MADESVIEVYQEPARRVVIARLAGGVLVATLIGSIVIWCLIGWVLFGGASGGGLSDPRGDVSGEAGGAFSWAASLVLFVPLTGVALCMGFIANRLPMWFRVVGVAVPGIGVVVTGVIGLLALFEGMSQM
jgi:hypothetical protein